MEEAKSKRYTTPKADAFSSMALWQFLSFIALLCFVWTSEILDLPALVFGSEETSFNLYRVSLLSAAIITAGIITVGHSYERQRRLVKQLLMTCLYCHRVKTDKGKWMHVEDYFLSHYPVAVDRNACPECQQMLKTVEDMHRDNPKT
ncbi:MAG: hypothetical protein A2283_13830 [Lentisphaerae bacterium RIFOXYA12_FULL_48_11]|nr:MAG: hypothetical protein A2283_13830 [Lentisphaerae bacterium RIFOXYA12_FULL_48_11]